MCCLQQYQLRGETRLHGGCWAEWLHALHHSGDNSSKGSWNGEGVVISFTGPFSVAAKSGDNKTGSDSWYALEINQNPFLHRTTYRSFIVVRLR